MAAHAKHTHGLPPRLLLLLGSPDALYGEASGLQIRVGLPRPRPHTPRHARTHARAPRKLRRVDEVSLLNSSSCSGGGVNHVESVGGFEAGGDLAFVGLHAQVPLAACEVEVEAFGDYAVGDAREATERIP